MIESPLRFPGFFLGMSVLFTGLAAAAPGDLDSAHSPPAGLNNTALCAALQVDGKVIVGGLFTDVGGDTDLDHLIRLNEDGTVDTGFNPPALNGQVHCLAIQPDGMVIVGGQFSDVGGETGLDYIMRLNADGTVDTSYANVSGGQGQLNNFVTSIALQEDGRVIVAGSFTDVSGDPDLDRVVRLDSDGFVDAGFDPPAGINDFVACVALQTDGKVIVGGTFTDVGGDTNRDRLVRLNSEGTLDTGYNPIAPAGLNNSVFCVALQPDGKAIVGGNFTDVDGDLDRDRIIRLDADGSLDTGYDPPVGLNHFVFSIALQADGKAIVGGAFTDAGGNGNRDSLIRLDAAGALDTGFTPPAINGSLSCVALQADGKVLIGGSFTDLGGDPDRDRLVRLENDLPTGELTLPDDSSVLWTRGGSAPEASRTTFEISTDGGASYSLLGHGTRIPGGWEITGVSIVRDAIVRAQAFTSGGLYNGSAGIVADFVNTPVSRAPTLRISGKKSFTTSRSRITLRGTASDADGDLVAVSYRDIRGVHRASGLANWSAAVVLKRGTNKILVAASDANGLTSLAQQVTIRRKSMRR